MKLLYSASAIQAAAFNILSDSKSSLARGMEILDNTVDLSVKQTILSVVDNRSIADKLSILANIHTYEPMAPSRRLQQLVDLRYCLSDWTLACCFHVGAYRALEIACGCDVEMSRTSHRFCQGGSDFLFASRFTAIADQGFATFAQGS